MAWEDFFNHSCDIYHAEESAEELGFGITNEHKFSYPDTADIDSVRCHFHIRSGNAQVKQDEALNEYSARMKLSLPIDTDIRVNDKVVDTETGYSYIAEIPRRIQNHHIIVYIYRDGPVKEAI
jgi:hypothetical protein